MSSIDEDFARFHSDNPHVYRELVTLARQAHARGYRRIGIELLFSLLRWSRMMTTTADQYGFKLNDHYTSRYARLIMLREPDLAGIFATRALRSRTPSSRTPSSRTPSSRTPGGRADPAPIELS